MVKIIKSIIHFSLRHRYFVFFLTAVLAVIGFISYRNTPIETFPDVTNTQVIIITQWPGRSAEEVEKFVTVPLETALTSVQKKSNLRTTSASCDLDEPIQQLSMGSETTASGSTRGSPRQ